MYLAVGLRRLSVRDQTSDVQKQSSDRRIRWRDLRPVDQFALLHPSMIESGLPGQAFNSLLDDLIRPVRGDREEDRRRDQLAAFLCEKSQVLETFRLGQAAVI